MSFEETPKNIANVAAAAAPAASYIGGASIVITIIAGLVSIAWMSSLLWKMYFPESFNDFIHRINKK